MSATRVRFAPSPTGQLHVGNARTALFNWLIARGQGGTLILRIEDTDAERSTIESEQAILADLRWLGLDWNEGPDAGGAHGPYRQSERLDRYREAAGLLLARRQAYYCFCTPAELEAERQAALDAGLAPKYNGRCRHIDPQAARERITAGEQGAVRFAVPRPERDITFHDHVRGDVTVNTSIVGDFVIMRSGGLPNYNFAVVIDDGAMEVSEVVRGEDHISNTPRQLLLYEALGMTPPAFAHLSLVLGPDHAPLSKRHGATSVAEFRERGYLAEALVNYLALLGWSPGENEEVVPVDEMARRFDLGTVSHSAAVFDVEKLAWMNRQYMKIVPLSRLAREAARYFERAGFVTGGQAEAALAYVESLMPMAIGSVDRIEEIPDRVAFLFRWNAAEAAAAIRTEPEGARVVEAFCGIAASTGLLTDRDLFRTAAGRVREATGLKGKALFHPLRVALTGSESGPELDLAVPAIERGAQLERSAGFSPIASCLSRACEVAGLLSE